MDDPAPARVGGSSSSSSRISSASAVRDSNGYVSLNGKPLGPRLATGTLQGSFKLPSLAHYVKPKAFDFLR